MTSTKFLYTALGDSITKGYSAPGKRGYVYMLATVLDQRIPCFRVYNAGQKGLTSGQLLLLLGFSPRLRFMVQRAGLLTLWIGGNDLLYTYLRNKMLCRNPAIYEPMLISYQKNINGILSLIRSRQSRPPFVCNLYNPFPHSALAWKLISALNHSLQDACNRWHAPLIDIYSVFQGRQPELIHGYRNGKLSDIRLVGSKPIHPNLQGHQVITGALLNAIYGS